MCNTCLAEAYIICEFIPDYFLVRSTKTVPDIEWYKGELALVKMNDPDVIFSFEPIKDPTFYMSEEESDKYYKDKPEAEDAYDKIMEIISKAQNEMFVKPIVGYELITGAIQKGFDVKKSFAFWLVQKLAEAIEEHEAEAIIAFEKEKEANAI